MRSFSWRRVWGIVLRHIYNFYHTLDRIVDAFYWPSLDIIIWGLTFSALPTMGDTSVRYITEILLAVILWYVVWRGQYEITVNFLEELWSDNLVNLFSTPLTQLEWTTGLFLLGFLKLILTVVFTSALAWFLYAVNIFTLGYALIPFIISLLVVGWWYGLFVASLFLRWGTKIQTLAWAGGYLIMPFSAVYFPLASLPLWVQRIGSVLPTTYIFEGMRVVVETKRIPYEMLTKSVLLNALYFSVILVFFILSFKKARERGLGHLK